MVQTANEVLIKGINWDLIKSEDIEKVMIAFADMHVREALKQASEKARKQFIPTGGNKGYYIVNKDSVLNAYSKKNIR